MQRKQIFLLSLICGLTFLARAAELITTDQKPTIDAGLLPSGMSLEDRKLGIEEIKEELESTQCSKCFYEFDLICCVPCAQLCCQLKQNEVEVLENAIKTRAAKVRSLKTELEELEVLENMIARQATKQFEDTKAQKAAEQLRKELQAFKQKTK